MKLFALNPSGTSTLINSSDFSAEFTTTLAEKPWSGTQTSTFVLAEDDRLLFQVFARNVGTMGAGTCHLTYNGANAANGDSFVELKENVTFKAESDPAKIVTTTSTLTASLGALLQKTVTTTGSLDASLATAVTKTTSINAVLEATPGTATVTTTASLDSLLQKTVTKTTGVDGLLNRAVTSTIAVDGLLSKTVTPATSLDALLLEEGVVLSVNWTGLLEKQGVEKTSLVDALLFKANNLVTSALDAKLVPFGLTEVNLAIELDAVLFQEEAQAAAQLALHNAMMEEEYRRRMRQRQTLMQQQMAWMWRR